MSYDAPPPPPPSYPGPPLYSGGPGAPMPGSNQKATWAMVLGIVGILCCALASIAALVLSIQAKNEIAASGGAQSGQGQAQAGFILGVIGCVLWVIGIIAYVGLFAASGN